MGTWIQNEFLAVPRGILVCEIAFFGEYSWENALLATNKEANSL